jgi:hypothetical protein
MESRSWQVLLDITLCNKVRQWLATGKWFSPGTPVSSTNKTDRHDITEILLKVALYQTSTKIIFFPTVTIKLWSVLYSDAAPDPILVLLLYSQHVCLFTGNYFGAGLELTFVVFSIHNCNIKLVFKTLNYLAFPSFDFERTWWMLFQKGEFRSKK